MITYLSVCLTEIYIALSDGGWLKLISCTDDKSINCDR